MKRELSSRHFESDDDIIAAVSYFLDVQDSNLYKEGIYMPHGKYMD